MFKSNDGVVLIEMLVSLVVISFIMLLLLNLMQVVTATIKYEQVTTKLIQVSTLISDDILSSTKIEMIGQCLNVDTSQQQINYCIKDQVLVRSVDHQGYERLITNPGLEFVDGNVIELKITIDGMEVDVPIWGKNE